MCISSKNKEFYITNERCNHEKSDKKSDFVAAGSLLTNRGNTEFVRNVLRSGAAYV